VPAFWRPLRTQGAVLLISGHVWLFWSISPGDPPLGVAAHLLRVLQTKTLMVDTSSCAGWTSCCASCFFLILTVVALLPASIYNIMIVIGLTSWEGTTRFVRAEFVRGSRILSRRPEPLASGIFRIIFRHMVPNAIAPVLVSATIGSPPPS
jgi:hypothetical protein